MVLFYKWATSVEACGVHPGTTALGNYMELCENFASVYAAWRLAFGSMRPRDLSNKSSLAQGRRFIEDLYSLVLGGHRQVAVWCNERRLKCCEPAAGRGKPDRPAGTSSRTPGRYAGGTTRLGKFLASGLDRAYRHQATMIEKQHEAVLAFDRLTADKPEPSARVIADVKHFVRSAVKKSYCHKDLEGVVERDDFNAATPEIKATYESSIRKGGQKGLVAEWAKGAIESTGGVDKTVIGRRSFCARHIAVGLLLNRKRSMEQEIWERMRSPASWTPQPWGTRYEQAIKLMAQVQGSLTLAWLRLRDEIRALEHVFWSARPGGVIREAYVGLLLGAVPAVAEHLTAANPKADRGEILRRARDHVDEYMRHTALERMSVLGVRARAEVETSTRSRTGADHPCAGSGRETKVVHGRDLPRRMGGSLCWPKRIDPWIIAQSPLAVSYFACRSCVDQRLSGEMSRARLQVFDNAIGKMRLATVHEGHVVLAAKAINGVLLKCLRNVRTNADMLAYKPVKLRNTEQHPALLRLYSADWKKATDHFSQTLARETLTAALEAAKAPRWIIDAVPSVTGNMMLEMSHEANDVLEYLVSQTGEPVPASLGHEGAGGITVPESVLKEGNPELHSGDEDRRRRELERIWKYNEEMDAVSDPPDNWTKSRAEWINRRRGHWYGGTQPMTAEEEKAFPLESIQKGIVQLLNNSVRKGSAAVLGGYEHTILFDREAPLKAGALMGLGPSWTAMSLLNDYAATRAGAPSSSFSVCGDDLIGLWTASICNEYERIVTQDLHLVVNTKKSYRGDAGVFCEMFVTRKSNEDEAIATPYVRLGEASGVVALRGNNGHYVVDTLRDISQGRQSDRLGPTCGIIRALAGAAATKFAVSRKVPGPLRCGGGGVGMADETTAKVFLMGGAVSTRKLKKTVYEDKGQQRRLELLRAYHKAQCGEAFTTTATISTVDLLKVSSADRPGMADPRLQQVMADAATVWNHTGELLYGQWAVRAKLKPATVVDHRKRLECRVRQAKPESWKKLLSSESVKERYSSDDRAAAYRHFQAGRFQKGIEYLRKHTRRISAEAADAISGRSLLPASLRKSKPGGTYRDART